MKTKEEVIEDLIADLIEQEYLLQTETETDYEEELNGLIDVIQVQIPNLISKFPNNSAEYVDTSPLSQELHRIRLTNKYVIEAITKYLLKSNAKVITSKKSEDLDESYPEEMIEDLLKCYSEAITSKKSEDLLESYSEAIPTKKPEGLDESYPEAITTNKPEDPDENYPEELTTKKPEDLDESNLEAITKKEYEDLLESYHEAITFAYKHMDSVNLNNKRIGVPHDIQSNIISSVKEDNVIKLNNLLRRYNGVENIRYYYDFALRVAARGSIQCLNHLISTGYANPMTPGPKSKKIALHHALESNSLDCIEALLKAQAPDGYYCPANQLLFGVPPTRPIDFVIKTEMSKEIANIIRGVMDGSIGGGMKTTKLQREEIWFVLKNEHSNRSSYLIS